MIKVFLYNGIEEKHTIAQLGDENQLHFFKSYVKQTYGNSRNIRVTFKKPYKKEREIMNTF